MRSRTASTSRASAWRISAAECASPRSAAAGWAAPLREHADRPLPGPYRFGDAQWRSISRRRMRRLPEKRSPRSCSWASAQPLDNFDNMMDFLTLVTNEQGFTWGCGISRSPPAGLLTRLINLAEKKLHVDALVSLHAPNDDIRRRTMPVARRWPMEELMRACRDYI